MKFKFLEEERPSRVVRLLRTHHVLMAFVGTIILLGTFIFKEAYRDYLHDNGDIIEKAEKDYQLGIAFLYSRGPVPVMTIETDSGIDRKTYALSDHPETNFAGFPTSGALNQTDVYRYGIYIGQIQHMLSFFARKLNVPEIDEKLEILDKETQSFLDEYGVPDAPIPPKSNRPHQDKEDVKSKKFSVNEAASRLLGLAMDTQTAVRNEARKRREQNQLRYKIATWVSYFLYSLGCVLGLVGRLVGVGVIGGD